MQLDNKLFNYTNAINQLESLSNQFFILDTLLSWIDNLTFTFTIAQLKEEELLQEWVIPALADKPNRQNAKWLSTCLARDHLLC
jgi:hypothetical protein